ncbi:MADCA protein, partial [Alcedo cyanopectus]|nr:MADCA protein [Ceyx cyanopectus]
TPWFPSLLCPGHPPARLVVTPQEPVVPYGGSAELNCSLACQGGTVQWKGLDTNLGSITSFPTHSILHISSATVTVAGYKICQGTCQGRHYQNAVELKVYALPDRLQLETEPSALVPGQPGTLRCSAQGVYPHWGMELTWYWGKQALKGTDLSVTEPRCPSVFTARTEQPVPVATSTGGSRPVPATTGTPSTALAPEPRVPTRHPTTALAATRLAPAANTTLAPAAATEPPSTQRSAPRGITAGYPTAPPATTTLPSPGTVASGSSWGSPPAQEEPDPSAGPAAPCSLRIWSLPPNGTRGRSLRIQCYARCPGNATVRWLRTPVALSQYREEAAGSSSTLWLDRAQPWHQGDYQCVLLGHSPQVVSLQLMLSEELLGTGPAVALGTTASLLGLLLTSVVSRRLCQRLRSRYQLP